jgi:hypothetical protein
MKFSLKALCAAFGIGILAAGAHATVVQLDFVGQVRGAYGQLHGNYELEDTDIDFFKEEADLEWFGPDYVEWSICIEIEDFDHDVDNWSIFGQHFETETWSVDGEFAGLSGTGLDYLTGLDLPDLEGLMNAQANDFDGAMSITTHLNSNTEIAALVGGQGEFGWLYTDYSEFLAAYGFNVLLAGTPSNVGILMHEGGLLAQVMDDEVWIEGFIAEYTGHLVNWSIKEEVVPEPATMTLLGLGIGGLAVRQFRRKRNKA